MAFAGVDSSSASTLRFFGADSSSDEVLKVNKGLIPPLDFALPSILFGDIPGPRYRTENGFFPGVPFSGVDDPTANAEPAGDGAFLDGVPSSHRPVRLFGTAAEALGVPALHPPYLGVLGVDETSPVRACCASALSDFCRISMSRRSSSVKSAALSLFAKIACNAVAEADLPVLAV